MVRDVNVARRSEAEDVNVSLIHGQQCLQNTAVVYALETSQQAYQHPACRLLEETPSEQTGSACRVAAVCIRRVSSKPPRSASCMTIALSGQPSLLSPPSSLPSPASSTAAALQA